MERVELEEAATGRLQEMDVSEDSAEVAAVAAEGMGRAVAAEGMDRAVAAEGMDRAVVAQESRATQVAQTSATEPAPATTTEPPPRPAKPPLPSLPWRCIPADGRIVPEQQCLLWAPLNEDGTLAAPHQLPPPPPDAQPTGMLARLLERSASSIAARSAALACDNVASSMGGRRSSGGGHGRSDGDGDGDGDGDDGSQDMEGVPLKYRGGIFRQGRYEVPEHAVDEKLWAGAFKEGWKVRRRPPRASCCRACHVRHPAVRTAQDALAGVLGQLWQRAARARALYATRTRLVPCTHARACTHAHARVHARVRRVHITLCRAPFGTGARGIQRWAQNHDMAIHRANRAIVSDEARSPRSCGGGQHRGGRQQRRRQRWGLSSGGSWARARPWAWATTQGDHLYRPIRWRLSAATSRRVTRDSAAHHVMPRRSTRGSGPFRASSLCERTRRGGRR